MNWLTLCRMLGLLGMLVGLSMLLSLPWAFPAFGKAVAFESRGFIGIAASVLCSVVSGAALYLIGRRDGSPILRKEALAIVGLGWIYVGFLGALPFLFSGTMRDAETPMTVVDAVFESLSGLTTTGASVLTELEDPELVPRCVLFWRSFTHWLGGMGIIVLFVAVLGQLGAGGKALMKREVPGPISENVRPRVRETAIVMWSIYVALSALLTMILLAEGLDLFTALCHTFGTLATGGFSTFNRSVAAFDSVLIEFTLIAFMVIAGTNFSLYYVTLMAPKRSRDDRWWSGFKALFADTEFRVYILILLTATIALTVNLMLTTRYDEWFTALRHSSFIVVTIMTTTGYGTENFADWSEFAKGLLLLLMFVGGCAGSTAGGVKVMRFILFAKIVRLEVEQAYRPNVVRPLRLMGRPIDSTLRHDVMVYFSLVLLIFVSSWMILAAIEPDAQWSQAGHSEEQKLLDCASAVAATLNNIGPGLGVLGPAENYSGFSPAGKLLLTLLMLLGRLELFAILVMFSPGFWRTH